MSSYVESTGTVAPAVAAGAMADLGAAAAGTAVVAAGVGIAAVTAAALGTGWIAWQAGKLTVETVKLVANHAAEERQRLAEQKRLREETALAGDRQLRQLCRDLLGELERMTEISDRAEHEEMCRTLRAMINDPASAEVGILEQRNAAGMIRLERMIARKQALARVRVLREGTMEHADASALLQALRLAFSAAAPDAGGDIAAPDPDVLERIALNERLVAVTARIREALRFAAESAEGGADGGSDAWFRACFSGIDELLARLYAPTVSNPELKKGIAQLEETMTQFETLQPTLAEDRARFAALYQVYAEAAAGLGEPIFQRRHFKNAAEIERELERLAKRKERADVCAELCRRMGEAAYLCYAWDQELRAMGYEVHSQDAFASLTRMTRGRAKTADGRDLPYYLWDDGSITKFYRVSAECVLQLIIHADGSVSMQVIAKDDAETEEIARQQKAHCGKLGDIYDRLHRNWFVQHEAQILSGPEDILSLEAWLAATERSRERARKNLSGAVGGTQRAQQAKPET